jgi:hypothetical protein
MNQPKQITDTPLNLDNLQGFLDCTHSRIMIGEMLTVSGVTAGCGR